jgi:hypothetical protein
MIIDRRSEGDVAGCRIASVPGRFARSGCFKGAVSLRGQSSGEATVAIQIAGRTAKATLWRASRWRCGSRPRHGNSQRHDAAGIAVGYPRPATERAALRQRTSFATAARPVQPSNTKCGICSGAPRERKTPDRRRRAVGLASCHFCHGGANGDGDDLTLRLLAAGSEEVIAFKRRP